MRVVGEMARVPVLDGLVLDREDAMSGTRTWLGVMASICFAAYFLYFLQQTFSLDGVAALAQGGSVLAVAGASLIYVLVIPLSGWAWSRLLADMGLDWPWGKTAAVIGVTQIAKYVPGNVGQHFGRAALVLSRRMPADVFGGSILLETILTMGAAALIGGLGWLWTTRPGVGVESVPEQLLVLAVLVLGVTVPGSALLFRLLYSLGGKSRRMRKWISGNLRFPKVRVLLEVVLAYSLNFLVLGLVLQVVCAALGSSARADYLFLAAAFAFAWMAGYLTPGLPAGLGAREGVLSVLLAGHLPDTELLNVLLGMRLATLVGDLLSFALGVWLARMHLGSGEVHTL